MSRMPNVADENWFAFTRSSGLYHQVAMRLSSPATAVLDSPTRPSLAASQRFRVTPWVHARRNVPFSSSRATSGAPQKIPRRAVQAQLQEVVVGHERFCGQRAVMARLACGDSRVVKVDKAGAGHCQDDRNDCQRAEGHRGLRAELEPGEPDHDTTPNRGRRSRMASPARLM